MKKASLRLGMIVAVAVLAAAFGLLSTGPSAVHAAGAATGSRPALVVAPASVCHWNSFGTSSNCDGQNPDVLGPSCGSDARTVESAVMRRSYDGAAVGPTVQLRYSPTCRTTWGKIVGAWGPDGDQLGCAVAVHRNSDGQEYSAAVPAGGTSTFTDVVYDADVTSYAYAACDTGPGYTYNGATASY